MLINEKKLNMMNAEHRKLLEQEMVNFLFEGKEVHIEGYTPEDKNKTVPEHASGNLHKTNTTRTRNDEKYLALALIAPLLISCSTTKKGDTYNEAWVKDTNGFDILMGQFAHNIENIWGFKEVVIAGPKDYVKYTDQYQTRSHINFDDGTITIETIAGTEPAAHLRRAIIKTLLMGDDPSSVDLYSDVDDITISKEPFLYGQVVDNTGQPIRWEGRASNFADYLLKTV